jgi:hypothetical protein
MKVNLNFLSLTLASLSIARAELMDCYPDTVERFKVAGTAGDEMRYCDWAGRYDKVNRCAIESVILNCPVTCEIPCKEPSTVIAGAVEEDVADDNGDDIPVGLIVGCVVGGVVVLALITLLALKGGKDEREYSDEVSKQSSLALNENGIVLSMSGGDGAVTDPASLKRFDSVATADVQKKGTFDSCCEPC